MPRTAPSRADQELMTLAAASGHPVSAYQLERWRRRGLIPEPEIRRLGRSGSETLYPAGTGDLVCALARHTKPGRTYDDLALLVFFDGGQVPELALKLALARAYFGQRAKHKDEVVRVTRAVPPAWAGELGAEYEVAEAEARISLAENGRAVRQMRINLRRLPDLARASREGVDARLLGVLTGLERIRLPSEDLVFMADLTAALDLECERGDDCLAVWDYAAVCHASQMATHSETSPVERFQALMHASPQDLIGLRTEITAHFDQMWTRASHGRRTSALLNEPSMARCAGAVLVDWMSTREVHPPGSTMADRYFIESLADLNIRCLIAALHMSHADGRTGEGRAQFIARTRRRTM
ncbi:hypothetical protein ABZ353_27895 [Streptomyces niveus]|uniref:hypothetical protein n=1 Tax=Streptomyces niveus TaxID=193462 RepID=UPI0033DEFF35